MVILHHCTSCYFIPLCLLSFFTSVHVVIPYLCVSCHFIPCASSYHSSELVVIILYLCIGGHFTPLCWLVHTSMLVIIWKLMNFILLSCIVLFFLFHVCAKCNVCKGIRSPDMLSVRYVNNCIGPTAHSVVPVIPECVHTSACVFTAAQKSLPCLGLWIQEWQLCRQNQTVVCWSLRRTAFSKASCSKVRCLNLWLHTVSSATPL